MGSAIRTCFVAAIDGDDSDGHAGQAREVLLRAGAAEVTVTSDDADVPGGHLVFALFPSGGDATRAAVELIRTLAATVRMAVCTGMVDGPCPAASPPTLARELLGQATAGQILTTTPTVVMVSGALPPGTQLLDRGNRVLGQRTERTYELVVDPPPDDTGADAGASNLEWARRAVDGSVPGIHDHLPVLEDAWKKAVHGKRSLVVVSGDSGVGKTTLVAELALRVHAEGALVLYGRWDRDVTAAHQAFREALGVYADRCSTERLRADLEGWGDEIARLLPDVGARVGGLQAAVPTAYDERSRLLEAVEAWFRALTRRNPTLLVLDDVHWAEEESFAVVDHLHLASAGLPLLIVVTLSDDLLTDEMSVALDTCPATIAALDAGDLERIRLEGP
jgi:hypothetical protein